jgi:hypothetical protein
MVLDYVITFEFETEPPLMTRGKVEALEIQTCAQRALMKAKDEFPRKTWSSVVVVLTREGLLDAKRKEVEQPPTL